MTNRAREKDQPMSDRRVAADMGAVLGALIPGRSTRRSSERPSRSGAQGPLPPAPSAATPASTTRPSRGRRGAPNPR